MRSGAVFRRTAIDLISVKLLLYGTENERRLNVLSAIAELLVLRCLLTYRRAVL